MALHLDLSYSERNDNKLLTLTDTTADYSSGGNIAVTDITAAKLDITITKSDGVAVDYDQIDLVAEFGDGSAPEFNNQAAMVFPLDATMIKLSGIALGTTDDELPDGIWEFTYTVNTTNTLNEEILLDGKVQNAVYELLRTIPTMYDCDDCHEKETLDIMFMKAYLDAIRASAVVSRNDSIINQLYTLERLITNVSHYTW
jgi:hypothetical protein